MEYKKGEKWGETQAPIANRFIISHDKANSKMEALEDFVGKRAVPFTCFANEALSSADCP